MTSAGTYTPNITPVTNVAECTSTSCRWIKSGNNVTVNGELVLSTTSAGLTELCITLPETATFTNTWELAGIGHVDIDGVIPVAVHGDITQAKLIFSCDDPLTDTKLSFSLTYTF